MQLFGLLSSQYSSLSLAGGLLPGQIQTNQNTGNVKMFVQNDPSGGNLTVNAALKFKSGSATSFIIQPTAASAHTDYVEGVNDQVTAVVPAGYYFWMTLKGQCTPLVASGVNIGDTIDASATAGTLSGSATKQTNIVAQAANSSGSAAATACYIH